MYNFSGRFTKSNFIGLAFIIILYTIRQMKLGYIPGPPGNRNSNQMKTHGLLMDDLNVYSTSHQQLEKIIQQAGARSKFFFFGGGGGRVGGLRKCHPPYHPLDFQSKIKNFCHPTLLKIRFKITVTPPPSKNGQSQNYGALTL